MPFDELMPLAAPPAQSIVPCAIYNPETGMYTLIAGTTHHVDALGMQYAKVYAHLDDDEIERIAEAVAQKWKGEDDNRPSTFWDVTSAQVHAHTAATMLILKQMDEIQRLKKLARQQDALLSQHDDTSLLDERAHMHQRYVQVMEGEQE